MWFCTILQKMNGGIPSDWAIHPRAHRCHATAGDWIFISRVFGFFAKHECVLHTQSVHKGMCKNQQNSRGRGCLKSPCHCNHTRFIMECPHAQHGVRVGEQSSLWSSTVARKAKGALTLFVIFFPASITTYTIHSVSNWDLLADWCWSIPGPSQPLGWQQMALHHSDESPWVQRYFISLQHVSAFSLPMMIIQ